MYTLNYKINWYIYLYLCVCIKQTVGDLLTVIEYCLFLVIAVAATTAAVPSINANDWNMKKRVFVAFYSFIWKISIGMLICFSLYSDFGF